MEPSSYTKKVFVVKKTSKPLLDLLNKVRDNKLASQEELRQKAGLYFPDACK